MRIFKCEVCGSMVVLIKGTTDSLTCCGKPMVEVKENHEDILVEKHLPVVNVHRNKLCVVIGEVEHPMNMKHYIEWIALKTNKGIRINYLKYNDSPETIFSLTRGETVEAVYSYCNIHGLWSLKFSDNDCDSGSCKL